MPTYEYRCDACGHEFERFQKMTDEPVRTCPECGKREVRRLISPGGGVVFKGPGFYATDYRSPRPRPGKEEGGSGSPGEKKSGGGAGSSGGGSEGG